MNLDKLTIKAQEALDAATGIAQKNDHSQIENEHVLLAMLRQENGIVAPIIERIGGDAGRLAFTIPVMFRLFGYNNSFIFLYKLFRKLWIVLE